MKTMKKILALVLALTLCLGLSVSGFATGTEGAPAEESKYTITINDAVAAQTYKAYKIFDAVAGTTTGSDGKPVNVSYTILENSVWFSTVAGYKSNLSDGETSGPLTGDALSAAIANGKIETGYVTLTKIEGKEPAIWRVEAADGAGTYAADFAKYLAKHTDGKTSSATETAAEVNEGDTNNIKTVVLDVTAAGAGYYFVDTSLGALTSLDTVTGENVILTEKNEEPTVEKEVQEDSKVNAENEWGDKNTADIGQDVNFQSTIALKYGAAKNVVLHDNMTSGLTFKADSIKVVTVTKNADGTETETEVTVPDGSTYWTVTISSTEAPLADGCTFEVKFDDDFIAGLVAGLESDKIAYLRVKYTATVNEHAVIGDEGNKNTAHLTYGNNSTVESTPSETFTYTYEFNVFKFYKNGETETALAGAKFQLYKKVENTELYAVITDGKLVKWVAADSEEISTLTSEEARKIKISGLDADTYYLKEIEAPEGYNILTAPIKIVITESTEGSDGINADTDGKVEYTYNDEKSQAGDDETDKNVVKVENKSGTLLPSTGGIGTTIFYVVGGILMLGAVILLITKKKMGSKQ